MLSVRTSVVGGAIFCAGSLLFLGCKSVHQETATSSAPAPQTVTCQQAGAAAPNPVAPTSLDGTCSAIPFEPTQFKGGGEGGFGGKAQANQDTADMYSWLTFIALNWPHKPGQCVGDASSSILKDPGHPTWTTWIDSDAVFKKAGAPDSWCGSETGLLKSDRATLTARVAHLPSGVRALAMAHPEITMYLDHTAKSEAIEHAAMVKGLHGLKGAANGDQGMQEILQATGDPIVDQNGRFARFEIKMSEDEYKFIVQNMLYTVSGQSKFKEIVFPESNAASHTLGTVELKSAWKVLGAGDDPTHFYTQQAIVYNDANGDPGKGPNPVTVGLIGLHILHKAEGQTINWAWSTFEQDENDTKSFFNPNCQAPTPNPDNHCVVNGKTVQNPDTAKELDDNGKPLQFPTQIQMEPYAQHTGQAFTVAFKKLLAGTPWQYYSLIGTQWTGGREGLVPRYLMNSVQETFVEQDYKGQTLNGCAYCHRFATGHTPNTEMSFMLGNAQQK